LPRIVLREISKARKIPLNQLYGVATFYAQFHLKRRAGIWCVSAMEQHAMFALG